MTKILTGEALSFIPFWVRLVIAACVIAYGIYLLIPIRRLKKSVGLKEAATYAASHLLHINQYADKEVRGRLQREYNQRYIAWRTEDNMCDAIGERGCGLVIASLFPIIPIIGLIGVIMFATSFRERSLYNQDSPY